MLVILVMMIIMIYARKCGGWGKKWSGSKCENKVCYRVELVLGIKCLSKDKLRNKIMGKERSQTK